MGRPGATQGDDSSMPTRLTLASRVSGPLQLLSLVDGSTVASMADRPL
jgi:hypothetical protein